jgi:BolA protein
MSGMQSRAERIRSLLSREFAPAVVEVADDSARHAGHAGARPEGETHYTVLVISTAFTGLGRIERHRRVNAALAQEFSSGLHALSLVLRTPAEHAAAGPA